MKQVEPHKAAFGERSSRQDHGKHDWRLETEAKQQTSWPKQHKKTVQEVQMQTQSPLQQTNK